MHAVIRQLKLINTACQFINSIATCIAKKNVALLRKSAMNSEYRLRRSTTLRHKLNNVIRRKLNARVFGCAADLLGYVLLGITYCG